MEDKQDNQFPGSKPRNMIGVGIVIGLTIGIGLGAAWHNIGAGIAIGLALGVAFGVIWNRKKKNS